MSTKDLRTSDMCLAATLIFIGHEPTNITKEGNRGTFHFSDLPAELLDKYDNAELLVEPVQFNQNVRDLNGKIRRIGEPT